MTSCRSWSISCPQAAEVHDGGRLRHRQRPARERDHGVPAHQPPRPSRRHRALLLVDRAQRNREVRDSLALSAVRRADLLRRLGQDPHLHQRREGGFRRRRPGAPVGRLAGVVRRAVSARELHRRRRPRPGRLPRSRRDVEPAPNGRSDRAHRRPSHPLRDQRRARERAVDGELCPARGPRPVDRSVSPGTRLLGRAESGYVWTTQFHQLPPSARFFAGGAEACAGSATTGSARATSRAT